MQCDNLSIYGRCWSGVELDNAPGLKSQTIEPLPAKCLTKPKAPVSTFVVSVTNQSHVSYHQHTTKAQQTSTYVTLRQSKTRHLPMIESSSTRHATELHIQSNPLRHRQTQIYYHYSSVRSSSHPREFSRGGTTWTAAHQLDPRTCILQARPP